MTTRWSAEALRDADAQASAVLPPLGSIVPIVPGHDVWDMWQVIHRDGSTAILDGRSWWFFLATPRLDDPEERHDAARIRMVSHGDDGWRDHDWVFPPDFTPGSREWSGSAVLDGEVLTMFFTAAGRRCAPRTFEQRLFETVGRFRVVDGTALVDGWSTPVESFAADGRWVSRSRLVRRSGGRA